MEDFQFSIVYLIFYIELRFFPGPPQLTMTGGKLNAKLQISLRQTQGKLTSSAECRIMNPDRPGCFLILDAGPRPALRPAGASGWWSLGNKSKNNPSFTQILLPDWCRLAKILLFIGNITPAYKPGRQGLFMTNPVFWQCHHRSFHPLCENV